MGAPIAAIVLGFIELLFGRKLFWVFAAIGGFLIGWYLIPELFPGVDTWPRVLIGIVVGAAFGFLSIRFTRVIVAIAGFFIFGGALVMGLRILGANIASSSTIFWVAYVIGGLIGAVLLFLALDRALIVLTSLAGAGAITRGLVNFTDDYPLWLEVVTFVILALIGIAFQTQTFSARTSRRPTKSRRV